MTSFPQKQTIFLQSSLKRDREERQAIVVVKKEDDSADDGDDGW